MRLGINNTKGAEVQTLPQDSVKTKENKDKAQKNIENNYKEIPDAELYIISEIVEQKLEETRAIIDAKKELSSNPADLKKQEKLLKSLTEQRNLIIQEINLRNSKEKPKLNTKS